MKTKVLVGVGAVVGAFAGAFVLVSSRSHTSTSTSHVSTNAAASGSTGRPTSGTLDGVKGKDLTLTTASGAQVTVKTTSSTSVTKMETGALSDIRKGDIVIASGSQDGTGALAATSLTDQGANSAAGQGQNGNGGGGFRNGGFGGGGGAAAGNVAIGRVASIDGNAVTVDTLAGGTTVVNVTPGTTTISVFRSVSLSQLTTGQPVVVRGAAGSNGVIDATSVQQGGRGRFGGGGGGGFGGRRGAATPGTNPA